MNTHRIMASIDHVILGIAALSAAAGLTDLAILGIIIHLTYNKLSSN